ncbi:MAG: adenine deaminase [Phycisphaerales bacterium]|nr:MAG: adenine deaminase [Phycisphaerales bacterium]
MLVRGGNVIDVRNRSIRRSDILIEDGRIAAVGSVPGPCKDVIDVSGKFVAPGLIDIHLHVESSRLSPIEFATRAVCHGTTSIFVDPHEIANVCGVKGVRLFLDQSDLLPLRMFVGIPSCVPATNLEDAGATIGIAEIKDLISHPMVFGLAEMMNFPGIIGGDRGGREKVDFVYRYGKLVDGHCPGLSGADLQTYISNGLNDGVVRIMSDHECSTLKEALDKARAGMHVALRYGSASKDLETILPGLLRANVDLGRFMLCSDDVDALDLSAQGHVDRIIRRARGIIQDNSGLSFDEATILALRLATLNPADYAARFLDLHGHPLLGAVEVGRGADLVVFDSLQNLQVDKVICRGERIVDRGVCLAERRDYDYTGFLSSVKIGREIEPSSFRIPCGASHGSVAANVIEVSPDRIITRLGQATCRVEDGGLSLAGTEDVAKVAVFERHRGTGSYAVGLVRGLGIERGAVASTVAHDSHNLIVAGADDESMARAVDHLVQVGGGMVVVAGDIVRHCPLELAGLMSTKTMEDVLRDSTALDDAARKTGTKLPHIFMTLSFLALPVIPEVRITNRGLIDVAKSRIITVC